MQALHERRLTWSDSRRYLGVSQGLALELQLTWFGSRSWFVDVGMAGHGRTETWLDSRKLVVVDWQ